MKKQKIFFNIAMPIMLISVIYPIVYWIMNDNLTYIQVIKNV
jgi:hypothetical protein